MNAVYVLKLISIPLIGAAVGYFTNWVAVKLLFRPIKPVRLLFFRLQGVIPKERLRLTQNLADTITGELLNEQMIVDAIMSDAVKDKIRGTIKSLLYKIYHQDLSIAYASKDTQEKIKRLVDTIIHRIVENVTDSIDAKAIYRAMSAEINKTVFKKVILNSLGLGDELVELIIMLIASEIKRRLDSKEVRRSIKAYTADKLWEFLNTSWKPADYIPEEQYSKIVEDALDKIFGFLNQQISELVKVLDLRQMIVDKLEQYDIEEFEDVVLSAIKNELKFITFIGAPLGFLVGLVNMLLIAL